MKSLSIHGAVNGNQFRHCKYYLRQAYECLKEVLTHPSNDDTILILKTLTTVAALLEGIKINDHKVKGMIRRKLLFMLARS